MNELPGLLNAMKQTGALEKQETFNKERALREKQKTEDYSPDKVASTNIAVTAQSVKDLNNTSEVPKPTPKPEVKVAGGGMVNTSTSSIPPTITIVKTGETKFIGPGSENL